MTGAASITPGVRDLAARHWRTYGPSWDERSLSISATWSNLGTDGLVNGARDAALRSVIDVGKSNSRLAFPRLASMEHFSSPRTCLIKPGVNQFARRRETQWREHKAKYVAHPFSGRIASLFSILSNDPRAHSLKQWRAGSGADYIARALLRGIDARRRRLPRRERLHARGIGASCTTAAAARSIFSARLVRPYIYSLFYVTREAKMNKNAPRQKEEAGDVRDSYSFIC